MDVASLPLHVRVERTRRAAPAAKTPPVLLWMLLAIAAVAALAYWDARRESAAALNDFAEEQATLASGAAVALERALERGSTWVRLSHKDAAPLGLPARTAVAGLSSVDARSAGGASRSSLRRSVNEIASFGRNGASSSASS